MSKTQRLTTKRLMKAYARGLEPRGSHGSARQVLCDLKNYVAHEAMSIRDMSASHWGNPLYVA